MICAIVARYPPKMGRKNAKGRKLRDALLAVTAPMAAEYLLNGVRYTCGNQHAQVSPIPTGAAGKEASRAELKNWFFNVNSSRKDRMDLTLDVFRMVKIIGFFAAARASWAVNVRQGEMVRRVLGILRRRGRHSSDDGGAAPRTPKASGDMRKPQREKPQSSGGIAKRHRIAAKADGRGGAPRGIGRKRVCFGRR